MRRLVSVYLSAHLLRVCNTVSVYYIYSCAQKYLQFDRDAASWNMDASISDKGVLLYNQALIHMRVRA